MSLFMLKIYWPATPLDSSRARLYFICIWINQHNPQSVDQQAICGSFHNLRINTQSVDQSKCLDQSTIHWSIYKLWITPQGGSIHKVWINPLSMTVTKMLRNLHFLTRSFPQNLPHFMKIFREHCSRARTLFQVCPRHITCHTFFWPRLGRLYYRFW